VNLTSSPPRLVRPGAIAPAELAEILPELQPTAELGEAP